MPNPWGVVAVASFVLLGYLLSRAPLAVTGLVGGSAAFAFLATWLAKVQALPRDLFGLWLGASVVLLPIAPYIGHVSPSSAVVRPVLAAALLGLILVGAIPIRPFATSRLSWLVVGLGAYQLVVLLLSNSGAYGGARFANWVMFAPLALVQFDHRSIRIAFASACGTGAVLLLGVALQAMGLMAGTWGSDEFSSPASGYQSYVTRYTSFLQNPNDLAIFMVALSLPFLGIALASSFRVRLPALVVVAICLSTVFLSSSRGALVAIPVGVALVTGRLYARLSSLVLLLGVILGLAMTSPLVQQAAERTIGSLGAIVSGTDLSANARRTVWQERISGAGNPLLGAGFGGYGDVSGDASHRDQRSDLYRQLTVDNGWLKLWLEEGFVGLFLFAAIIFGSVAKGIRRELEGENRLVGAAAAGALAVLAVRATSTDVFDINPWNFFGWLLVAILGSVGASNRTPSEDEQSHDPLTADERPV